MTRLSRWFILIYTAVCISSHGDISVKYSNNSSSIMVQQQFQLPAEFNVIWQVPEHERKLVQCEENHLKVQKRINTLESQLDCLMTHINDKKRFAECPCGGCNAHGKCKHAETPDTTSRPTFKCHCGRSWSGEHCENPKCYCSNHGTCDGDINQCVCDEGWTGRRCQRQRCPNDCSNHGRCIHKKRRCRCQGAWTGKDCSKTCDSSCAEKGHRCSRGVCICMTKQYYGANCQFKKCPDCGKHGICMKSFGNCVCHDGWQGKTCREVAMPSDLKVKNITQNQTVIEWKQPKSVEQSEIKCVPSGNASAVFMQVGPNVTQVTIVDLEHGTNYTVNVYSKIEDQLSKPATLNFKTLLPKIQNLKMHRLTSSQATCTWLHPVPSDPQYTGSYTQRYKYKVFCSCSEGGAEYITNENSFTVKNLAPGVEYSLKVFATDLAQTSEAAVIKFRTPLAKVRGMHVQHRDNRRIVISWLPGVRNPHDEPLQYEIKLLNADRRHALQGRKVLQKFKVSDQINTYQLAGLLPGTLYRIEIKTYSLVTPGLVSRPAFIKVKTLERT